MIWKQHIIYWGKILPRTTTNYGRIGGGIEHHAEFVGMKSQDEVAYYMRESALLVLPSQRETFGAVLVEALACGTPVVATRCGGPEDIVNDQVGLLVPPEDPQALAEGIASVLYRQDEFDPIKLRAHALERFSWDNVTQQTIELYSEAVRGFKRGS